MDYSTNHAGNAEEERVAERKTVSKSRLSGVMQDFLDYEIERVPQERRDALVAAMLNEDSELIEGAEILEGGPDGLSLRLKDGRVYGFTISAERIS